MRGRQFDKHSQTGKTYVFVSILLHLIFSLTLVIQTKRSTNPGVAMMATPSLKLNKMLLATLPSKVPTNGLQITHPLMLGGLQTLQLMPGSPQPTRPLLQRLRPLQKKINLVGKSKRKKTTLSLWMNTWQSKRKSRLPPCLGWKALARSATTPGMMSSLFKKAQTTRTLLARSILHISTRIAI